MTSVQIKILLWIIIKSFHVRKYVNNFASPSVNSKQIHGQQMIQWITNSNIPSVPIMFPDNYTIFHPKLHENDNNIGPSRFPRLRSIYIQIEWRNAFIIVINAIFHGTKIPTFPSIHSHQIVSLTTILQRDFVYHQTAFLNDPTRFREWFTTGVKNIAYGCSTSLYISR